jgi:peptidoglycan/xylan/chitin deacetylase (PgdA/CDA1 family)
LRSTAYILTAYLGGTSRWLAQLGEGDRPMLSARQVRDLDEAGVEIGAHGHRHLALDEMPLALAETEIDTCRIRLEEIVDHAVVTFAYPFGYHSGRIKRYLEASGFESACAVKQALSYPGDDRFALARAIVGSDLSTSGLDAWLRGEGLPLTWQTERPQTKVWRVVRRVRRVISGTRSESDV